MGRYWVVISINFQRFAEGQKQYKDYSIGLKWPSDSIAESFSLWLTCIEMCWSISEGSRDIHSWRKVEAKTVKGPWTRVLTHLHPDNQGLITLEKYTWVNSNFLLLCQCMYCALQFSVMSTFYIDENVANVVIFEITKTYQFQGSVVAANNTSTRPGGSQD